MSLRVRLIEAGARARYERMVERMVAAAAPKLMILPDWGELDAEDRQAQIETSGMYFDAFLDTLAENADEWVDAATEDYTDTAGLTRYPRLPDLIAVLREDRP